MIRISYNPTAEIWELREEGIAFYTAGLEELELVLVSWLGIFLNANPPDTSPLLRFMRRRGKQTNLCHFFTMVSDEVGGHIGILMDEKEVVVSPYTRDVVSGWSPKDMNEALQKVTAHCRIN